MGMRDLKETPKVIAVGIVVNDEGKVLIAKRKDEEKGKGDSLLAWVFPGGVVEPEETVFDTVRREVFEETGYRVSAGEEISSRKHPQIDIFIHYVLCELENGLISSSEIIDEHEISERLWVNSDELEDYFTTNLDPGVKHYFGLS